RERGQPRLPGGVTGLRDRVLDEGGRGLLGRADAERVLRHELDAAARDERLKLCELVPVAAREHPAPHHAHGSTSACASSSRSIPLAASSSCRSSSARWNAWPSAVPWISTKPPTSFITTFMSVSASPSSA